MSSDRRKQEIEEKRAKLAELRKAREERRNALAGQKSGTASGAETPSGSASTSRAQLNDLVSSILNAGPSSSDLTPTSSAISAPGITSPSGRTSRLSDGGSVRAWKDSDRASFGGTTLVGTAGANGDGSFEGYAPLSAIPDFSDVTQELFELVPRPRIVYDKSIQTSFTPTASIDDSQPSDAVGSSTPGVSAQSEETIRARAIAEYIAEKKLLDEQIAAERARLDEEEEEDRLRGLNVEGLKAVYSSGEFGSFMEYSGRVALRLLSDNYDYMRDYTIGAGEEDEDDSEGRQVKCTCTFSDDRWTKNRSVTSLDWSPKFPELSVAAYNKNPMAVNEPDGIACVWNLHLLERPEFVFHSQSDVLSVSFSPFHPTMIVGGTYSGQILLWDTRSKHLPVLKSPLSASGHTHPIYSLSMVGTQNAHNLISASTDGTVCAWVLDMLARPQETVDLTHPSHSKTDEVSVTSMSFPDSETTTFWVGTEEGNVYAANRYDRAGAKAGLVQSDIYRGHSGPVLGIHFHPLAGPIDFSDLFLTCGVDWTVKLWRAKGDSLAGGKTGAAGSAGGGGSGGGGAGAGGVGGSSAAGAAREAGGTQIISPVHTFEEADDYIFDVKWHPAHPAMFGSVDGSGKFDIWNLNLDTEVPMVSTTINPSSPKGLNKLAWDRREGRRAAIGASDGKVYIYDIGTEMATPAENEWDVMRKTFSGLLGGGVEGALAASLAGGGGGGGAGGQVNVGR